MLIKSNFFSQAIMQERDEERERLRRELQRSQDQIHAFLSTSQSQVSGGLIP